MAAAIIKNEERIKKSSSSCSSSRTIFSKGSKNGKLPKTLQTSKSVMYGRLLFIAGLAAVAASLGYLAFQLATQLEQDVAESRFEGIAERALTIAQLVVDKKKLTTDSLAHVAAAANPHADKWPNVYIEGFEEIATSLRLVTKGQEIAFCPIVIPGGEEQASFEEFAYDLYEDIRKFPNGTGVSSFGKGIFSESRNGDRFHDVIAWTDYASPNKILVPILQLDQGYHTTLLGNLHDGKIEGDLIDEISRCSKERASAGDNRECGSITDMMENQPSQHVGDDPGPGALIFVPTYPRYDNTTVR
jgi:hypothetical protein